MELLNAYASGAAVPGPPGAGAPAQSTLRPPPNLDEPLVKKGVEPPKPAPPTTAPGVDALGNPVEGRESPKTAFVKPLDAKRKALAEAEEDEAIEKAKTAAGI